MQSELGARLLMGIISLMTNSDAFVLITTACTAHALLQIMVWICVWQINRNKAQMTQEEVSPPLSSLPSNFLTLSHDNWFLHDVLCKSCISYLGPSLMRYHLTAG